MTKLTFLSLGLLTLNAAATEQSTPVRQGEVDIDCALGIGAALKQLTNEKFVTESGSDLKGYLKKRYRMVECHLENGEIKVRLDTGNDSRGGGINYWINRDTLEVTRKLFER